METQLQSSGGGGRPQSDSITISLCGDIMTGRGIDQILPHPGDPTLHERSATDAKQYVALAERAGGPIPKPVDFSYVWGAALEEWNSVSPDASIANLETSVTTSDDYWLGKEVHYRMNPLNVPCLAAAAFDGCSLANNHVLDWGVAGLVETLHSLKAAKIKCAGAGLDHKEAAAPAVMELPGKGRLLLFSMGSTSSGIPCSWAAKEDRPGVNLLADLSEYEVRQMMQAVERVKRERDVVIASIHWGSNWGDEIPEAQRTFAHQLLDVAGVDLIHGHSSHHVRAIEVHRGRLILYGCGDFIDDYEGISGYEPFRSDLGSIYFASVDVRTGRLRRLWMTPTQVRRMRIVRAAAHDVRWMSDKLNRVSREYGVRFEQSESELQMQWSPAS